ncbi:MAG: O-antigen ligase family protein [Erysipelotrichaceae bacterium]
MKTINKFDKCFRIVGLYFIILYPIINSVFINSFPQIHKLVKLIELFMIFIIFMNILMIKPKLFISISFVYLLVVVIELFLRGNSEFTYFFKDIILNSYLVVLVILNFDKVEEFEKTFINVCLLAILILGLSVFINIENYTEITGNWLGYQVLLPYLFIEYYVIGLRKYNIKYLFALIVGLLLLFLGGTRTPLLLSVILCVILVLLNLFRINKKYFCMFLIIIFISGLLFFPAMRILDGYLLSNGIVIRLIHLFADLNINAFFNFSGRIQLFYVPSIMLILSKPILGYGLGMDQINLCESITKKSCSIEVAHGYYSHNIVLEIFQELGLIFGLIVIITIIILIIYLFRKNKKFAYPLLFSALLPLLISSSWFTYMPFWIFISYSVISIRNDFEMINKFNILKNKLVSFFKFKNYVGN